MEKPNLTANPLVSIIIPVYNAEKYIAVTITSALNQTWINKEIIVIDDGSTDGSLKIAQGFESIGVKVIHQKNKGASAARNLGLQQSRGEYLQFLDADDLISKDKIEKQIQALNNNLTKVAVCSTIHFRDGELHEQFAPSLYEENFLETTNDPVNFLIRLYGGKDFNASMIQPNAWLTPKTVINISGPWNEDLTLDDDGEFFSRVILASKGIVKTEGLNYYRKYPNLKTNLSSKKNKEGLESAVRSVLLKKEHLFNRSRSEQSKKAIYKQLKELAIKCYLQEPALYKMVLEELKGMPKYKYKPILGGTIINTISNVFGWKLAKRFQKLYSKLLIKY